MAVIIKRAPDVTEKLGILSRDAQYDLACACAPREDEHRVRSQEDKWVYPVSLPQGGTTYLFKTLLSNECVNNCKYCPLRAGSAARRCRLSPEELAQIFLSYYRAGRVSGLFLSSGVRDNPDAAMERINTSALLLRRARFRGYIHLKIIPGASEAAMRQSLALASAVSLNIETPGESSFKQLSTTKDYMRDILRPLRFLSRMTAKGSPYHRIKQTTQFVVGAADETDKQLISASGKLYKEGGLDRIYFSAYQRGAGAPELPGERSRRTNGDLLAREHRLYQADWLIRKYGFGAEEIPVEADGNLSLTQDPKEAWALGHPEFFPVNVNKDEPYRLLRVPGLGAVMAERILALRKDGAGVRSLEDLGKPGKVLQKARPYITF